MTALTIDPAIQIALRAALAMLFAWAAIHKLRGVASFREALRNYELLPNSMAMPATLIVIGAEISIALTLLLPFGRQAAVAAAALLVLYTLAIVINLARGRRDIDCGCAGPAQQLPLSGGLIARNLVLVGAAILAALPNSSRALTSIDAITIIGMVVFLGVLYGAIEGLLDNGVHRPQAPIAEALR